LKQLTYDTYFHSLVKCAKDLISNALFWLSPVGLITYLLADGRIEEFSGKSRLVLVGSDHRSVDQFATPEAIQMTEVLEYSKRLGNSQYTLPTLQVYKFVYASYLAELGFLRRAWECAGSVSLLTPISYMLF